MPRKGKGSKMPNPNRTDLNTALPKTTAGTGDDREWGSAKADLDAQAAVPMGPPPGATPAPVPGDFGPLTRPTEMPSQPITAGAPVGPGPGPEALTFGAPAMQARQTARSAHYVKKLADITGDPYLARLLEG